MKSANSSAISSTLSPHAQLFISTRLRSTSAVIIRSSIESSPVESSPFQPTVPNAIVGDHYDGYTYNFSDGLVIGPISASSSSYPFPNAKHTYSHCPPIKKLEIGCDPTSNLSSDDDSLIDSPCYKGRNWYQITPLHMGKTSPPPRVTAEKLVEDQNLSVAATTFASLMVSGENENGLIGFPGDNPRKQNLDPGSSREGILQKMVAMSDMLLQIPLNAADLAESDDMMIKMIIEDLKMLLEKSKKKWYFDDNEDNIEATVYKNLLMNAEKEKCEMSYKLQNARMVVDTGTKK